MALDNSAKQKSIESMSTKPMSILWVLLLVLSTNVITVFLFSGPLQYYYHTLKYTIYNNPQHVQYPVPSNDLLIAKLNQTQQELLSLETQLKSSKKVSENLAAKLANMTQLLRDPNTSNDEDIDDPWLQWGGPNRASMSKELQDFVSGKKLPFGRNPNFGSDTIYPPIGHACAIFKEDLNIYMDYKPGHRCPDDEILAQKLMLRGCEPLPRRRCYPKTPSNYSEPFPFPKSMWKTPPDSSVVWTAYSCKNYKCLIQRKYRKVFDDCKDCFDLEGREKTRWLNSHGSMDYSVDEVLNMKKNTIRIGLDIGGGTGTFAVRMRERNVTIITTSMNLNGPFNSFIASRGVIPMYITVTQRLPFFDNTLDIVHSMHVLSNWIPTKLLEFIFYDIYRILRPGGLFWLDHFFCIEDQLKMYVPMIEKLGFNKLKWSVAPKLDRGAELKEMYITALLEKPLNRH
jgi:ubiquinone/menaquinone biosynthesis C-methylase UbiE